MKNYGTANLLQDPISGHLWLHAYAYDSYILRTENGRLDLATCNDVKAHIVKAANVEISMASYDTLMVRNDEGMYSLLIPFEDSMGYGAIYRSVEPGFTFKEAFALFNDFKFYVITQNEHNTWDTYNISRNDGSQVGDGFAVAVKLNLGKEPAQTLDEALRQIDESLSLEELANAKRDAGYLTKPGDWGDYADFLDGLGHPMSKIRSFAAKKE